MKNIAIIISTLKGGGAERVVSLLSKELSKNHNIYIFLFDSNDIAYPYGGTLIDLNIKATNNLFMKINNFLKRIYRLRKSKKKYKIDCSISFMESANLPNILSKLNDTVIISIHSHLSKRKKNFLTKAINPIVGTIYKKSDEIIGVSQGVANDIIKQYNFKKNLVSYIHNPIDIETVKKLSEEEIFKENNFKNDDFKIINVGRLTHAKGQWHLIRALTYVKKEIPNIKLLILGNGDLKDYLVQLTVDLDLEDNVIFFGYKENPFKYINKSDLFVLSSIYEGFGNVIVEAMATKTAILSTDCKSGPREILAPKTIYKKNINKIEYAEYGILVPTCDGNYYDADYPLTKEEEILAKGIIAVYNNSKLKDNYSELSYIRSKDFDIGCVIKKWEHLINL